MDIMADGGTFYLDGTKLANLVEPVDDEDAATKHYIDTWSPLNNIKTYKYAINNKRTSFMNLSGLVSISATMEHKGQLSKLLGCQLKDESFFFKNNASVKDKYLQIEYLHAVWVKEWSFFIDKKYSLKIDFKWQASIDGANWVDIAILEKQPEVKGVKVFPYYDTWELKIPNPMTYSTNTYKFWRIYGLDGVLTYGPYYNLLLMNII
jgi:hypothetical protein